jgi:hypothetical protein
VGYRAVVGYHAGWDTMPTGWDGADQSSVKYAGTRYIASPLISLTTFQSFRYLRLGSALTLRVCPVLVSASSTTSTAEYC